MIRWISVTIRDKYYNAEGRIPEVTYSNVVVRVQQDGNKQRLVSIIPQAGTPIHFKKAHVDSITENQMNLHAMREKRDPNTPEKIIYEPVFIVAV